MYRGSGSGSRARTQSEEEERDGLGQLPKEQKRKVDITSRLREKWSQPVSAIGLEDLRNRLRQPFAEDEKIPITQETFDELCTPYSSAFPTHELSAKQVSTLFRISPDEYIEKNTRRRLLLAIETTPPTHGTEDLFHHTWDENISLVLGLVLSNATPIRNSNRNTSTALKRPDYGLLIKNNCVLRGEEKGLDSTGDPDRELVDKLIWTYDPLPYVLGYHAVTTNVNFVAITRPPSKNEPLFDHDLNLKAERVANIVHLIRLSGVVIWLGQQLHFRNNPEFMSFERPGGLVYMNIGATVRKEFRHDNVVERVTHLVEIYKLLKRKKVPNVDNLESFSIDTENGHPHVYLSPVGIDTLPASGLESFNAVVCVLAALKVMHSSPDPVYHRDIREPNIIKRFDGQGWFLIDWSDASTAPTLAVTHLKESEHSPRVRQNNHGAEVDMWGMGKYMGGLASRVTCQIAKPDAVQEIAKRWMTDLTTSAASALEEIMAVQDLFYHTPS